MAAHYSVTTDFVYFQARENGLSFAVINKGNPTLLSNGKSKNPEFCWDPGFKVSFGYFFHHDEWSLYLNFLHFHTRITDWYPRKENTFPFPTWSHLSTQPGFVDDIRNRWRLHLGLLDLLLKRPIFISDCLSFNLHAGLRYAEVRQKTRIDYFGGTLFPDGQDDIDMKNKFWGFGPRAGIDGSWNFFERFGAYFNAAIAFPYGLFYVHQDESSNLVEDEYRYFKTFQTLRIITEMAAGFRYVHDVPCRNLTFDIHGGYEIFFLFGQNQFSRFLNQSANGNFASNFGDLVLHGFSLGMRAQF